MEQEQYNAVVYFYGRTAIHHKAEKPPEQTTLVQEIKPFALNANGPTQSHKVNLVCTKK